jgi:thiol-disulfide isomerase/thioredoxin
MGGEKIYVWLVENYFTYEKAYWSDSTNTFRVRDEARRMKPSLLGATGGELFCTDTAGNNVSLYQVSKRFTVLYMYNPDCELCQKETPKLKKVYDEWKDKGMVVYALNVEHDREKWLAYIDKLDLDWINVWDPKYQSRYYEKYFMTTTPGIYVLDENHKIICTHLGADLLPTLFERELEKK